MSRSSTRAVHLNVVRDTLLAGLYIAVLLSCTNDVYSKAPPEPYYGRKIGDFPPGLHNVTGAVYAVDETTIFIKGFDYDGMAPDAYFWVGVSKQPSPEGFIVPFPEDYDGPNPPRLQAHNKSDIIIRLPAGKRIREVRWLSVWCRRFTVDFGHVLIDRDLDIPRPRVLPEFRRLAHGLRSSNISVLDAKTFYIPNLHYDGAGPDAYFWVGNGPKPSEDGIKVPNESGSLDPLRGYQGEDIEIVLPGNLTVYEIDWLAVWCVQYQHNFGHVLIPKDLDVPPALGQTKLPPSWWYKPTTTAKPKISNCRELLGGRLQVKWEIQGDHVFIDLYGRINEDQYMGFGISGAQGRAQMVGADVVIAFYDRKARVFRAEDYFLSQLAQCDGKQGVCPDERIGGKNDITFLFGERKNGVTTIKYKRPLQTNEPINDVAIRANSHISVIGAIGPLNSQNEANSHVHGGSDVTSDDEQINFSSTDDHNCVASLYDFKETDGPKAWPQNRIVNEKVLNARIGPTGGKRGYTAITGIPSWGISWWINDQLIPEIVVERGQTYSFIVEGGDDPTQGARYHPFYITSSAEGGYGQKKEVEQLHENVFAGVEHSSDGYPVPTGTGRYCEWQHVTIDKSAAIESFEDYKKTLHLECEDGVPGVMNWTVPMDAPDLLYYQCYTHRNLGWKIIVVEPGEAPPEVSAGSVVFSSKQLLVELMTILVALVAGWVYA